VEIRAPKFGFLGDFDPQILLNINATPERHFLSANRINWAIVHANLLRRRVCSGFQEKKKGKVK
jgi:hypothetical protein